MAARERDAAVEEMVRRLFEGDRRALARIITLVEEDDPSGRRALRLLYPRTGRAHTVGVTGAPGSGKSTLVCALAKEESRRGRTVGIVAVDPSSAFTHGAILGDRIRMQELTADPNVFVRSMASRGLLGGLAPKTAEVVATLGAAGKDVVIIETLGAGQDEVDIVGAADTTVVLITPDAGDDVQAMKAGLIEAADVLALNKADLPSADGAAAQLKSALSLSSVPAVPIVLTVAMTGQGVIELADAIDEHRRGLEESGELARRHREQSRRQVVLAVRELLSERALASPSAQARLEEAVRSVEAREVDPWSAAEALVDALQSR